MSSTDRQNNLLVSEDWQKIYQSFKNADFQSYDFDNLRRTMIDYIRTNFPEDFNDYIESSEYLALIDLIAYVGQSIAFRVDLNARENFLELAERRDSILRLARLISYNPSRNVSANGLLKVNTVQTTENVIDSNGRNLSGQYVTWNDPSNPNWYDQFIKIINAGLPQQHQFGNPVDQANIYGIPTAQYRFNSTNTDIPIYTFSKSISGRNTVFEITSTTFAGQERIYEEAPKVGNSIACVYKDDGRGAGSPSTGFFFNFVQGTLNQGTFNVSQPTSNQVLDIESQNINDTDVWLYSLNQSTGLEDALWTQVPALTGNNIIYNSLSSSIKTIYSVISRANDAVSLSFSDGVFGTLPQGNFRVYYRVSNGITYTINPTDIVNVIINVPYTSATNQAEVLTLSLSLATSVANASATESNASIKTNAPQSYYTQNRMITGEDYNISPLSASTAVAKIKALNRASSGISRYFDLTDPTGKYSSTNLFADDGILYQDLFTTTTNFTYANQTDIQNVIYNAVYNILKTPGLRDFYYTQFVDYLTTSLNVAWNSVTTDSNTVSGYVYDTNSNKKYAVGSYTFTDLKYFTPSALVKFLPPAGKYFDTLNQNILKDTPAGPLPKGGATYIWAQVTSVRDDGTASDTGVLSTGFGPIVLDDVIPTGSKITQIIPKFATTLSSSIITTMIDLIFSNVPFGLRYDVTVQSWQIIFENNLSQTGAFNLINQGSSSPLKLDASWFLLFTTDNDQYTITSRQLRYVFESDQELTFYFDSNVKIYDTVLTSTVTDTVKILSINTDPLSAGGNSSYTKDMPWQVVGEFVGEDGYVDPTKIILSFADSTNTGVVDNPQLFTDIVYTGSSNPYEKYVVQELYSISQGQEDYRYVSNNALTGPVFFTSINPVNGKYYYSSGLVTKYNAATGKFIPTLDYIVYVGRDKLKFQYIHSADYDSRIDPGPSNLMDLYVLTNDYNTAFRLWISAGAPTDGSEPLPPSSDELNVMLSPNLNLIKSISDEIIYHPVSYTLLFGAAATSDLQANFNVVINPASTVSSADVSSRILSAINRFFALDNWDFGDTFYFSELSTYVLTQLSPDVISFVIVPTKSDSYFGGLFEIRCPSNKLFVSCATTDNIVIVAGLTSTNLRTVTGAALNSVVTSQNIISAALGAD
jgi:hypothetical protein